MHARRNSSFSASSVRRDFAPSMIASNLILVTARSVRRLFATLPSARSCPLSSRPHLDGDAWLCTVHLHDTDELDMVRPIVDEQAAVHQRVQQLLARALRVVRVAQAPAGVDQRELHARSV